MDLDDDDPRPMERPLWVKFALWGLAGRESAWAFFWLSITIAVGCIAYGFVDSQFFVGSVVLFAALWYFLAIRWVDGNGKWE